LTPNRRKLRLVPRGARGSRADGDACSAESYADTFRELYRAVYEAVEAGVMPDEPDFSTFEDGHRAQVLGDAIADSHRQRRWLAV
jgi:predicted dehydrogenase